MDERKNEVYLSLGTNLGNRQQNINQSIIYLKERVGSVIKESSVYETDAWGDDRLNVFYNSVVVLESDLTPNEILFQTQSIEKLMGREKKTLTQYENRVIDIDVLFFNNKVIDSKELILPHPQIEMRKFVLMPLLEISPQYIHPILKKSIQELYVELNDDSRCIKLS